jgi:hypothetical protein
MLGTVDLVQVRDACSGAGVRVCPRGVQRYALCLSLLLRPHCPLRPRLLLALSHFDDPLPHLSFLPVSKGVILVSGSGWRLTVQCLV